MKHELEGTEVHIATGGRPFDAENDVILMLHGSGQNHLTWVLQSRYFAYRGFNILAPDFPGHGLSNGVPLETIEDMALWTIKLMDSLNVPQATFVGHSQGCLVTIEAAATYPNHVKKIALIAAAMAIPVNQELLNMSDNELTQAIAAMTNWGHGSTAHMHDNTQPGHSFIGYGNRLMALNDDDALRSDLKACSAYKNGPVATSTIQQPALCVLAEKDRMTPIKFGFKMAETLANVETVVINGAGHMLPAEHPTEVNMALRSFFE